MSSHGSKPSTPATEKVIERVPTPAPTNPSTPSTSLKVETTPEQSAITPTKSIRSDPPARIRQNSTNNSTSVPFFLLLSFYLL